MQTKQMAEDQIKDYLLTNWMTHDALWYREVASRWGMSEASPMNLRVCRHLGKIEFKRLLKATGSGPPKDMNQLKLLYEEAKRILVPPFFEADVEFEGDTAIRFLTRECFAYKGMKAADLIHGYACGIYERIDGWFDAMGVTYTRMPDLSLCLKHKGQECQVTFEIQFA
jgi:hypothetical protein